MMNSHQLWSILDWLWRIHTSHRTITPVMEHSPATEHHTGHGAFTPTMEHSDWPGNPHTTTEPVQRVCLCLAYQGISFCGSFCRINLLKENPSMTGRNHTALSMRWVTYRYSALKPCVLLSTSQTSLMTTLCDLPKKLRVSCVSSRGSCTVLRGREKPSVPSSFIATIIPLTGHSRDVTRL